MSEWSAKPLSELTTKIGSGATPRGGNSVYTQSGVALIRSQNVLDHTMKNAEIAYISDDAARALNGVTVHEGDVLINITGDSIARCSLVDGSVLPARVNQHVSILRTTDEMDPRYLQRYLVNAPMKEHLLSISAGGTRNALTKAQLGELVVRFPSIKEQQAIAEVLGALDDKIAINIKVAQSLAEMASLRFNAAVSGIDRAVPLAELVSTQYGVTTSAHDLPGPKFLRVTDINKQPWIEWDSTPNCTITDEELTKYRVSAGDILVARMADPGKAAYIDQNDPEAVFASYLVRLVSHDPEHALYLYYFLRSPLYAEYAESAITGSVQKNMNARVIVATDVPLPEPDRIVQFNQQVMPLRAQIRSTLQENRKLVATRNTLLPQLMSGKLRVKDAVERVESLV